MVGETGQFPKPGFKRESGGVMVTAIQTVGNKGYDGFAIALMTDGLA